MHRHEVVPRGRHQQQQVPLPRQAQLAPALRLAAAAAAGIETLLRPLAVGVLKDLLTAVQLWQQWQAAAKVRLLPHPPMAGPSSPGALASSSAGVACQISRRNSQRSAPAAWGNDVSALPTSGQKEHSNRRILPRTCTTPLPRITRCLSIRGEGMITSA